LPAAGAIPQEEQGKSGPKYYSAAATTTRRGHRQSRMIPLSQLVLVLLRKRTRSKSEASKKRKQEGF
jgi:hypothetical protein